MEIFCLIAWVLFLIIAITGMVMAFNASNCNSNELQNKIKEIKKEHKINKELKRLGLTHINQEIFDLQCRVVKLQDINHSLLDRIIKLETKGKK